MVVVVVVVVGVVVGVGVGVDIVVVVVFLFFFWGGVRGGSCCLIVICRVIRSEAPLGVNI